MNKKLGCVSFRKYIATKEECSGSKKKTLQGSTKTSSNSHDIVKERLSGVSGGRTRMFADLLMVEREARDKMNKRRRKMEKRAHK